MSCTQILSITASRLWNDEAASVHSAELVLIMTLLIIGMLVGMKSMRDSAVTEFADLGQALSNLNQSYSYSGLTLEFVVGGTTAFIVTTGSQFVDTLDYCDTSGGSEAGVSGSRCVNVCNPAQDDGLNGEAEAIP